MDSRDGIGSWLEGVPTDAGDTRGARLGLPADGPGALAPLGRRVVALVIDWAACLAISGAFFGGDPMATLGVFALENVLLVGSLGTTVGHRILGLRVRVLGAPGGAPGVAAPSGPTRGATTPVPGRAPVATPGPVAALVRTVLLCLVVPAVVWDGDGRGMHDRAARTVIVRR